MRTRRLAVGIIGIIAIVGASPAGATPPTTTSGSDADDSFLLSCGTFDVWDHTEFSWAGTEHYDRDGNLVRVEERLYGFDRLYNPLNGKSVEGSYSNHETVDLANGDVTQNGAIFRIVIPGGGAVFVDIGKYIVTFGEGVTFLGGRHDFFAGDIDRLCAYLA